MSHENETQEPSGSLDALTVRQIGFGLDHIVDVIDDYCMLLLRVAPDSLPAVHAILHLENAKDEIGSAGQLVDDVFDSSEVNE